ncbi:hypothetical protein V8C26DRAFT_90852 [Trichoderma gracile]
MLRVSSNNCQTVFQSSLVTQKQDTQRGKETPSATRQASSTSRPNPVLLSAYPALLHSLYLFASSTPAPPPSGTQGSTGRNKSTTTTRASKPLGPATPLPLWPAARLRLADDPSLVLTTQKRYCDQHHGVLFPYRTRTRSICVVSRHPSNRIESIIPPRLPPHPTDNISSSTVTGKRVLTFSGSSHFTSIRIPQDSQGSRTLDCTSLYVQQGLSCQ